MFYIRDLESKKYLKVWKDSKSKRKWHWKYTIKPFASVFEDKQIKRFYSLFSKKERDKILYTEYTEKGAEYSTKLLAIACVAVYACVFLLLGLLIAESTHHPKEELAPVHTSSQEIDFYSSFNSQTVDPIISAVQERKERVQNSFYSQEDSERIYEAMLHYAKKYGIPCEVACTLIHTESDGRIDARHGSSNCLGLTQLALTTAQTQYDQNGYAKKTLTTLDVLDIETNLDLGFAYYIWCVQQAETISPKYRYGYDVWDLGYLIYNVGVGDVFSKGCKTYLVDKKNPRSGGDYKAIDRWSEKREMCEELFEGLYNF